MKDKLTKIFRYASIASLLGAIATGTTLIFTKIAENLLFGIQKFKGTWEIINNSENLTHLYNNQSFQLHFHYSHHGMSHISAHNGFASFFNKISNYWLMINHPNWWLLEHYLIGAIIITIILFLLFAFIAYLIEED